MPIYEYRCLDCRRKTQVLTLSASAAVTPRCGSCGGLNLRKLVSRVAIHRSEESRMERLADPSSLSGLDENDPQSVARWMKTMGREMGEDLGEDFDREIDQAMDEAGRGEGGEPSGDAETGDGTVD